MNRDQGEGHTHENRGGDGHKISTELGRVILISRAVEGHTHGCRGE